MANSKAQIYPIQLQNAELNLNKFDAEIKQYSGFNKNNAPFIGGCLSNVFSKTQQGENADNVYIAPNGDEYSINNYDLAHLRKNGQIIATFKDKGNFWNCIEVDPSKYITDNHVVKIVYPGCVTNINNNENPLIIINHNEYGDYYINDYKLTPPMGWNIPDDKDIKNIFCCITPADYDGFIIVIHWPELTETTIIQMDSNCEVIAEDVITHTLDSDENYTQDILSVYFKNNYLYVFNRLFNETSTTSNFSYFQIFKLEDGHFVYVNKTSTFERTHVGHNTRVDIVGRPLYLSSNPYGVIIFGDMSADQTVTTSERYTMRFGDFVFKIYEYDEVNNRIGLEDIDSIIGSVESAEGETDSLVIKANDELRTFNMNNVKLTEKNYFSLNLNMTFELEHDGETSYVSGHVLTDSCYFHGCNFEEVKGQENTYNYLKPIIGESQKLSDNIQLLYNNGLLSGIAAKHVLLTDWNSVDIQTLTYNFPNENSNEEAVCYKQNDKYYLIYAGSPKVRRIGNYLVTNTDALNNAWDLVRNIPLNFAPAFNCSPSFYGAVKDGECINFNDSFDIIKIKIVAAINEYKLQDIPSLLLNPQEFLYGLETDKITSHKFFDNFGYEIDQFIYDESSNSYIYLNSYSGDSYNKKYNPNLIGLPYPIQTDGNVQYSASLFSDVKDAFGNKVFIKNGGTYYPLIIGNNSESVLSFYLASGIDNLLEGFIVQGQFYGIINDGIYSVSYVNGVVNSIDFIVDITGLQYCGSTPYEAIFFSKTNRCLYSFVGANVLNPKQFVDKISEITMYKYNPATQSIFLVTDIGVIVSSLFGIFQIDILDVNKIFLLDNGVCFVWDNNEYTYIKYYKEPDDGYTKKNIELETCFYGANTQTITITDCLYMRLFSEEHEEGDVEVSVTTLLNEGKATEKTTFKIKASDWDKETHTVYIRYQPKNQRGVGSSFKINSPFRIAALSVGAVPDAILQDKVSKGAITTPQNTSATINW